MTPSEHQAARERMVRDQLEARDIRDAAVLEAMRRVPRHLFVSEDQQDRAYADGPLGIGFGQTISQPYIVGLMAQLVRANGAGRVLDVGTGCGYQAAVLSELAREVWSIERIPELAHSATERLALLGYDRVHAVVGDGFQGLPAHAPYDGIVVACAPAEVPRALSDQLAKGRLVIPIGRHIPQCMVVVERDASGRLRRSEHSSVGFVPMVEGS